MTGMLAVVAVQGLRARRLAILASNRRERQRVLGTCDDAHAGGAARVELRGERGAVAVRQALELADERQPAKIAIADRADLEHAVRAHLDAVALALAPAAIDGDRVCARLGAAILAGSIGVAGGATGLRGIQRFGTRHGSNL